MKKATQKVDVVVNLRLLASKTKVSCGDIIDFSIDPDTIDSSLDRTYKFFYVDETGYEKTIQAYSKENKNVSGNQLQQENILFMFR